MRNKLFAYILITLFIVGCNNQVSDNEPVLDDSDLISVDIVEPTPTPIQKKSSGEMKYNHPKITGEVDEVENVIDEIIDLSLNSGTKLSIFLRSFRCYRNGSRNYFFRRDDTFGSLR